jgi:ion channel-forming bestrophin family protein
MNTFGIDDRFWEGRKLWSAMKSQIRSQARIVTSYFPAKTPLDKAQRVVVIKLLIGFAVAVKHHLRGEHGPSWDDFER